MVNDLITEKIDTWTGIEQELLSAYDTYIYSLKKYFFNKNKKMSVEDYVEYLVSKIYTEMQKKKKKVKAIMNNKLEDLTLQNIKTYYKATIIQTVEYWHKSRTNR